MNKQLLLDYFNQKLLDCSTRGDVFYMHVPSLIILLLQEDIYDVEHPIFGVQPHVCNWMIFRGQESSDKLQRFPPTPFDDNTIEFYTIDSTNNITFEKDVLYLNEFFV